MATVNIERGEEDRYLAVSCFFIVHGICLKDQSEVTLSAHIRYIPVHYTEFVPRPLTPVPPS